MTVTLSPEALDLVQRGRLSLIEGAPEGHTGDSYWTGDGARRCGWGHIMKAYQPDHDLDEGYIIGDLRRSALGIEIDTAYEALHGESIDCTSWRGWVEAVAGLEALILAAAHKKAKQPEPA